ncbi:MAG: DNA-binding protein WhiA [Clostridiales bacterium]|nr:DNA-binding protein WhiA [Clostridiales bacterium]
MNFSEEVKSQVLKVKHESLCCKKALLAAFLRTAGSIGVKGGNIGIEMATDIKEVADRISAIIKELYGLTPVYSKSVDKPKRKDRTVFSCIDKNSIYLLIDLGIIEVDKEGANIKLNVNWETVEDDCCKTAYIRGAFLGSGSVTLPKDDGSSTTGYHLEFVFTNYQTATDFCEILSEVYFMPKLIERKETYIVYLKTIDEITELLAVMGADEAVEKIVGLAAKKEAKNNYNRKLNCEISNMSKQMSASAKQINAVLKIREVLGLDSLPENLQTVAKARLQNKDLTMVELADKLKITKSCLNHRLRKIVEISENI